METQTENQQSIKTSVLRIPIIIAAAILKKLQKYNVTCTYLRIDPYNRICMKVHHESHYDPLISDLNKIILVTEELSEQLLESVIKESSNLIENYKETENIT